MKLKVMTVTPQLAERWLNDSKNIRLISDSVVNKYADLIRSGGWNLNGETIKMREDGTIVDGFHRLHAIVLGGRPVEAAVAIGDEIDVLTVDEGSRRGFHQLLGAMGVKHAAALAATVRALLHYHLVGDPFYASVRDYGTVINNSALMTYMRSLSKNLLDEVVGLACQVGNSKKIFPPAPLAFALYLCGKADVERMRSFAEMLVTGAGIKESSAVSKLREWAIGQVGKGMHGRGARYVMAGKIIKAWNLTLSKSEVTRLVFSVDEKFPEVDGLRGFRVGVLRDKLAKAVEEVTNAKA